MEYRNYIFLFLLFLLISSTVVINNISKIKGTTDINGLNKYGIIVQGIFLVLGYIIIEVLIDRELL